MLSVFINHVFFFIFAKTPLYQAHPWFKDVAWDKLYEMQAAFKPEVNGELDTQNFMKFDEVISEVIYFIILDVCNYDLDLVSCTSTFVLDWF